MSEPTNAEIQKEHDEVATSHERTFEDGELAHYHRGILLKRLVALDAVKKEAERLWSLLDDISTAGDMFKPTIDTYFRYVNVRCESRNGLITSDGYSLFFIEECK